MKILRTEQEVIEFVERLSPDEAAEVLKQLTSFDENDMEGFGIDQAANGKWIVKLAPKSNGTVQ